VKDGEVIAWHDSPHALYLILGIKPGLRYMHINTVEGISPEARARVQADLAATAGRARFIVSDLEYLTPGPPEWRQMILGPPRSATNLMPAALEPKWSTVFPFNQHAIFRSRGGLGRYVVHELTPPLEDGAR